MPVYKGDSPVCLEETHRIERDGYGNHKMALSMHVGTHLDAPSHFIKDGMDSSELPLESLIAGGCCLDVRGESVISYKEHYETQVPKRCILLLFTDHARFYKEDRYYEDHPVISEDFARFAIGKEVRILGMDAPSIDKAPYSLHRLLLSHQVLLLENLVNLEELLPHSLFEVMVFPLKVKASGAQARVIARVF